MKSVRVVAFSAVLVISALAACEFGKAYDSYCDRHPGQCVGDGGAGGGSANGGGVGGGGGAGGGGAVGGGTGGGATDGGGLGPALAIRLTLSQTSALAGRCIPDAVVAEAVADGGQPGLLAGGATVRVQVTPPEGLALYNGPPCGTRLGAQHQTTVTLPSAYVESFSVRGERVGTYTASASAAPALQTLGAGTLTVYGQLKVLGLPNELVSGVCSEVLQVAIVDADGRAIDTQASITVNLVGGPLTVHPPADCAQSVGSVTIAPGGGGLSSGFRVLAPMPGSYTLGVNAPNQQGVLLPVDGGAGTACVRPGDTCLVDAGFGCCTSASCTFDADAGLAFCRP